MPYVKKKRKVHRQPIATTTCPFCLLNDEAQIFKWEGKTGKKGLYLRCFSCQTRGFGLGITVLMIRREQDGLLNLKMTSAEWQAWKDGITFRVEEAPKQKNVLRGVAPEKLVGLLP